MLYLFLKKKIFNNYKTYYIKKKIYILHMINKAIINIFNTVLE